MEKCDALVPEGTSVTVSCQNIHTQNNISSSYKSAAVQVFIILLQGSLSPWY